jgi:hypothetical protein
MGATEIFPFEPDTPFAKTITDDEWSEICQTGKLTGAILERYWRMSDFQSPMPAAIEIQIRKSDVDRLIREIKRP